MKTSRNDYLIAYIILACIFGLLAGGILALFSTMILSAFNFQLPSCFPSIVFLGTPVLAIILAIMLWSSLHPKA